MHNLFGDTNAVHVTVDDKGYSIDQVIDGETVAEVLDYVQYNPKKLVRTLETWVTKSVKEGRISVEDIMESGGTSANKIMINSVSTNHVIWVKVTGNGRLTSLMAYRTFSTFQILV